jgi:hypothetical protein
MKKHGNTEEKFQELELGTGGSMGIARNRKQY